MIDRHLFQRRWVVALGLFGAATLLGVTQASQSVVLWSFDGRTIPWSSALIRGTVDWYLWAALTPLLFQLTRHLPMELRTWKRSLLLHMTVCLVFGVMIVGIMTPVFHMTRPPEAPHRTINEIFRLLLTAHIVSLVWTYWSIVGVCHALNYYRKYQERKLRASQLEARLAQAQVQVLRMQLNPHFLFNTLNVISALMHRDVELADRMIARLGDLLRMALRNDGQQEVPLWKELQFIHPYLEIEKARLGDRLTVSLDIAPDTLDACVPNLFLQPIVENAIHHGIAARTEPGQLVIRGRKEGAALVLEIADDGVGLPDSGPKERIGLANTRARLQQLYGDRHQFTLANLPTGGARVRMLIPFHDALPTTKPEPLMATWESSDDQITAQVALAAAKT